ncbi:hypothetical protein ACFRAQ_13860 [Nocardia sp. NPDC056611]|uniref:hypothetical protein n=1 Tax=Nocardia sp. NPDC056611 TaxID=3345877 RepID=UPI00366AAF4E
MEYVQHQLSATDHGFWPAATGVETTIPEEWRIDGLLEARSTSLAASLDAIVRMRSTYVDEQNVFDQARGQLTGRRGGLWWTPRDPDTRQHRTVALLQRHPSASKLAFRDFVHETLGPALRSAGAAGLRTYTLQPATKLDLIPCGGQPTPGHHNAILTIDTASRDHLMQLFTTPLVSKFIRSQAGLLARAHAYTVTRSIELIPEPKERDPAERTTIASSTTQVPPPGRRSRST